MLPTNLVLLCTAFVACTVPVRAAAQSVLPETTYSGYLSTNKSDGSELYFAYYEANDAANKDAAASAPVLLWLQVCTADVRQKDVGTQNECIRCFTGRPRVCQHVWQPV